MSTTREEILEHQRRTDALRQTELGKAFFKFRHALEKANRLDVEDSFTDKDRKSTAAAREEARTTEREFRTLLEKALGIP
jgi:hypothetical protein